MRKNKIIGKIEQQALNILKDFPQIETQPASISGRYHVNETIRQHLESTVSVMKHLCEEFNIQGSDKDMLIACAYLHDLGIYIITLKQKIEHPKWEYYESGYSKPKSLMKLHPIISAQILEEYDIDRKAEIQRIVATHMSHWYKHCPQPENLFEYLLCASDFIASKGMQIFEHE